jgi:Cu-Zn family superoxide dismutase
MRTQGRRIGDVTWRLTLSCAVLAAAGCARAAQSSSDEAPEPAVVVQDPAMAVAELRDPTGAPVGTARLTADENGTIHLVLHVDGMTPGQHGVHFHSVGSCQRGDSTAFASAGGHHNPLSRKHGLENPDGPHAGDLPNLTVASNGMGHLDTTTSRATLRPGPATLFDADGSAVVVHAGADDQKTDPSGNSGARVACGVIMKS